MPSSSFFSHHCEVVAVEPHIGQTGVHINADPLGPVCGLGIKHIKLPQPLAQIDGSVVQQLLPTGVPAAHEHGVKHRLYELLLAGEIAVKQGLRHPDAPRQFTRLNPKACFRKIGDGCIKDLLSASGWIKAHPRFF